MSDLTRAQHKELRVLDFFAFPVEGYGPKSAHSYPSISACRITASPEGVSPERAYFAITDAGATSVKVLNLPRLYQLLDAKRWRLRQMDQYEQGILHGETPYGDLLEDTPVEVAKFMAVTLFQGLDKKLILNLIDKRVSV